MLPKVNGSNKLPTDGKFLTQADAADAQILSSKHWNFHSPQSGKLQALKNSPLLNFKGKEDQTPNRKMDKIRDQTIHREDIKWSIL